ncbi:MAG: thymidine kinase [Opitutales bacterium]|jgi:thymidine kinase|nr:thymidine kinase [Opitutales bacterium]MDP4644553.1 thymidine kinase [Opitutales bacterium]MDP4777352.1 thymidine kinase [Opitutales bacterium]MDP4883903.1 thymidine kinase [Opitutales bacterium]MDP5079493.1 thymidine kinase [Opitutales bacterium]
MAKLYFYYSAMNAGKSTVLLQSSHNYQERGMQTLLLTPEIDQRAGADKIASRIGLTADAITFKPNENLFSVVCAAHEVEPIACVLIDEAQFLYRPQVEQLSQVCDEIGIPVLCYGLRTDFQGNLFTGSAALLGWADNLIELKTICYCGRKATMNLRQGPDGKAIKEGEQVEIGGNERYVAMCRKHFTEAMQP